MVVIANHEISWYTFLSFFKIGNYFQTNPINVFCPPYCWVIRAIRCYSPFKTKYYRQVETHTLVNDSSLCGRLVHTVVGTHRPAHTGRFKGWMEINLKITWIFCRLIFARLNWLKCPHFIHNILASYY